MMFGLSKTFYSYQVVDNHKKTMTKPEGKWAYLAYVGSPDWGWWNSLGENDIHSLNKRIIAH